MVGLAWVQLRKHVWRQWWQMETCLAVSGLYHKRVLWRWSICYVLQLFHVQQVRRLC